jgi:hypothetical protein
MEPITETPTTLDPDAVTYTVLALMSDSATQAVRARQADDFEGAAVLFGHVSGLFDTLVALGLQTPAESAVDVMLIAEQMVAEFDTREVEAAEAAGFDPLG